MCTPADAATVTAASGTFFQRWEAGRLLEAPAPAWWAGPASGGSPLGLAVAILVAASVLVPILVLDVLATALLSVPLSGTLPEPRPLFQPKDTQVLDATGAPIATFRQFDTSLPMAPGDVPTVLKQAVVASEDRRFYEHHGVDSRSILRALWADLTGGRYLQGASTIDEQYIRLAYSNDRKSLSRKAHEAVLAGRVDAQLSKDQILFGYLSRVYLGNGLHGVAAAAQSYFRKPVHDLTLSEAALLASVLPAPTVYNPRVDPAGAERRRQVVLTAMADQGRISTAQLSEATAARVVLVGDTPPIGAATVVYRPKVDPSPYPWFTDYVRRYLVARYGEDLVARGGLRVETSLDRSLQADAEASVGTALSGTRAPLDMAMVVIDPHTGLVKALVGGRDFTTSQVNLALGNCAHAGPRPPRDEPVCVGGGGSGRQPGSSFKPFTLAKAFEEGITPDRVYNAPSVYTFPSSACKGVGCTIHNAESGGFGALTLRQATAFSVNTVFAQLILDVGVVKTAEMAHRLGITMVNANGKDPSGQPYGPSLTLGAADVSPLDMAAAYSVFADHGKQLPAAPVTRVIGADGKILEDNTARAGKAVLTPVIADQVTDVLEGVIASGTGTAANIGWPNGSAGKTGTTEAFTDAWFVGYTPGLVASVWMGYSDASRPLTNIKGIPQVFGGTLPAQAWHDFMAAALAATPPEQFVLTAPTPPVTDTVVTTPPLLTLPPRVPTASTVPAATASTLPDQAVTLPPFVPLTPVPAYPTSSPTSGVPGYPSSPPPAPPSPAVPGLPPAVGVPGYVPPTSSPPAGSGPSARPAATGNGPAPP